MPRIIIGLLLLSSLSLPAQLQFNRLGKQHLPIKSATPMAGAVGDINGDGNLDLVWVHYLEPTLIQLGDGHGRFTDHPTPLPGAGNSRDLALGDIDGDGDLDILVGNYGPAGGNGHPNQLLINDGKGNFTDVTATNLPVQSDRTYCVAMGDLDGDKDLDILYHSSTSQGEAVLIFANDGKGRFTSMGKVILTKLQSLALGDVDGDGDLDLACGTEGIDALFINDGTGRFTAKPSAALQNNNYYTMDIHLRDLDGDLDLDLVCTGHSSPSIQLFLNDGTGTLTDVTASHLPTGSLYASALSSLLGDVDGDGDLDLLVGQGGWDRNGLFINDGTGRFSDQSASRLPTAYDVARVMIAGDLDKDGDLDFCTGNLRSLSLPMCIKQYCRLYLNDGTGSYAEGTTSGLPASQHLFSRTNIILFDADGDGNRDMLIGPYFSGEPTLCLNDGNGNFRDITQSAFNITPPGGFGPTIAGDIDGNGTTDLLTGYPFGSGTPTAFLNNGKASFVADTSGRVPSLPGVTWYSCSIQAPLELMDLDGDGDLDLFYSSSPAHILTNNGSGFFNTTATITFPSNQVSFGLGDVDGDGDPDLVAGLDQAPNLLYLNDGTGRFTTSSQLGGNSATYAVLLRDIDNDGDLDLICGNDGGQDRLYRNDGKGNFADITNNHLPISSDYMVTAADDLDGDGNVDLIGVTITVQTYNVQKMLYLRGDGTGGFTDHSTTKLPSGLDNIGDYSIGKPLCDLDGDGDKDILISSRGLHLTMFANLNRQMWAPYIARPGRPFQLQVHCRRPQTATLIQAFPVWSPGTGAIDLGPIGIFRLDLNRLFPLPSAKALKSKFLDHAQTLSIPPDPTLIGQSIHFQTLILASTGTAPWEWRLTNLVSETISGI